MQFVWLDTFYLLIACMIIVGILIGALEIGFRLARSSLFESKGELSGVLGSMVGGGLGLLAFVLAFTFSIASSHYDLRKDNVIEEANAIGTAYLRADLLPGDFGPKLKELLREYTLSRVETVKKIKIVSQENLMDALEENAKIHEDLWQTVAAAAKAAPSPNTSLAVQAVNDVIDVHTNRIAASVHTSIPGSVWAVLGVIATMAFVTLGVQVGFTGKRNLPALLPLVVAFALLVLLAFDLDRPRRGLLVINQEAMVELISSMK